MNKEKIEIRVEKVEIKPGARRLKGDWKVEIDPEPVTLYYYPSLWERIWNRILNVFGKGKKNWIYDELMKEFFK